jgi:hypothetical protein
MSYEEAHWPRLSPAFRNVHNELRRLRGQPTIPEPRIDLYIPPRGPDPIAWNPHDTELHRVLREMGAEHTIPEAAT